MKVFAIFSAYGDGDSNGVFDLVAISSSLKGAHKHINEIYEDPMAVEYPRLEPVHNTMTPENKYTFIGTREQVDRGLSWNHWGGYVIEEIEVIEEQK